MTSTNGSKRFEATMLPHLNAAYTLARWLTGNVQDAEDVVQDAYLRAFRFFDGFREGNSRAWLLQIVRNTCYTRLREKLPERLFTAIDDDPQIEEGAWGTPEVLALRTADIQLVRRAIRQLPIKYREVLIMREIEGMSYSEMAKVLNLPMGSVASTLLRARERLKKGLIGRARNGSSTNHLYSADESELLTEDMEEKTDKCVSR